MRYRSSRCVLRALLLLVPTFAGCQLFGPSTVPVLVRDAETKQPLPNAVVTLKPLADSSVALPKPPVSVDPNGVAKIDTGGRPIIEFLVEANAPGYLSGAVGLNEATHIAGPKNGGVIELFNGPRPVVVFVLPKEFHGIIRADMRIDRDKPFPIGQREFEFAIQPEGKNGLVEVVGPPVLKHWPGPEYRAKTVEGVLFPIEPADGEVALRWVRSLGESEFFLVGTRAELAKIRGSEPPVQQSGTKAAQPAPSGGGGGRKGGGSGGRGS